MRLHARVPAVSFTISGAQDAAPAPGVLAAIADADFVLLPPSNPVVSIGVILAVPGIADAVRAKTVVGVSPIIGGAPVRGMADACLAAIGVPSTAAAVAAHYGPDSLNGWLVDTADAAVARQGGLAGTPDRLAEPDGRAEPDGLAGIEVRALPLYMTDAAATAAIADTAIELAMGAQPG